MITMSRQLRRAVRTAQDRPVRLADPETKAEYVVLPAEVYDQMKTWFYDDSPLADEEQRALLIKAGLRAGWDTPAMEVYNDLDPRRQP